MTKRQIVDAHHHFWDITANYHPWLCDEPMIPFRYGDYSQIRRNYLPPDYRTDSASFELVSSVYVEAEWNPQDPIGETRWIHTVAETHGLPGAIVAQAWLDHEDAAQVIAQQAGFERVRSVRHKPAASPDPGLARRGASGSMDDKRWRAGFAALGSHGLHFDLQTPWWHFDAAADLARDFPDTTIILNHTGLPSDRTPDGLAQWQAAMETLAKQPNVKLKISGLGQPGQAWTVESNGPVIRDALSIFGVERSMFASNFPVDSVVASFEEIYRGFESVTEHLSDHQKHLLFVENALQTYRIPHQP
ncbi:MAG: amidohydrolase [Burkholderiaceae bacterium]